MLALGMTEIVPAMVKLPPTFSTDPPTVKVAPFGTARVAPCSTKIELSAPRVTLPSRVQAHELV